MNENQDIFDRIMSWPPLKGLQPFYKKNKEILLYLFFGGLTTVVSFITYWIPARALSLGEVTVLGLKQDLTVIVSNVISWVCAVTFAYLTNRAWVFQQKAHDGPGIAKECAAFFAGRLFTLLVETALMNLGVTLLHMNDLLAKVIVSIVTIILNYIISKLLVFKDRDQAKAP